MLDLIKREVMAVRITGKYLGNKRMELTHELSGAKIQTSAPIDNNGDGQNFSPTDLVAAALGSCVMTILSIHSERDGVDLTGMWMEVEKHMVTAPRRISPLVCIIHLPRALPEEYRQKLERAGNGCPVHHSLAAETNATITYNYDF